MAVVVVDELEAIEVEKHHGERPAMALGACNGLCQTIIEQRAVGQAGLLVVHGNLAGRALGVARRCQRSF
jgi:hypothetical protein